MRVCVEPRARASVDEHEVRARKMWLACSLTRQDDRRGGHWPSLYICIKMQCH